MRFGKHPPKHDYRTLRFGDYTTSALAPPPASADTLARAYQTLGQPDTARWFPIDGNDRVGDCTIAAVAHIETVNRALIGQQYVMREKKVLREYYKLTGGLDTGLYCLDVLNHWRQEHVGPETILAFVKIDPRNHEHVQQAIAVFGSVYVGFQVQENCIADFETGTPWSPGNLLPEGHCVAAVGYDDTMVNVLTWGATQLGTWLWWDQTVDEAYAILPREAKRDGWAPGFDFAMLEADLADVAG